MTREINFNPDFPLAVVARAGKTLKMGEKMTKYSAAVARRYGEDRFCHFLAQIQRIDRPQ
ncbi:MAG: hypothetical protein IDH49_12390 [Gammaproteobacteria bacterium]|nr:hypothetical protein [Gammaproteobacteria bacterium]